MGMFDKRQRDEPSGYSSHGEQPSAQAGGVLTESSAHLAALDRAQQARDLTPTQPSTDTPPPIVAAEPVSSFDYETETFTLQPGEVRQIAGRDPLRKSIEVNNLSGERVQLAKTDKDARAMFPPVRSITLPAGGTVPRKFTHSAPVFLVVDPAAADVVEVDVIAERAKPSRP